MTLELRRSALLTKTLVVAGGTVAPSVAAPLWSDAKVVIFADETSCFAAFGRTGLTIDVESFVCGVQTVYFVIAEPDIGDALTVGAGELVVFAST